MDYMLNRQNIVQVIEVRAKVQWMQIDVFIVIGLDIGQVNAEEKTKKEGIDLVQVHIADQGDTQVAIQ